MTRASDPTAPELPFEISLTLDREDAVDYVRLSNYSRTFVYASGLIAVPLFAFMPSGGYLSLAEMLRSPAYLAVLFTCVSAYVLSPLVMGELAWRGFGPQKRRTVYPRPGSALATAAMFVSSPSTTTDVATE